MTLRLNGDSSGFTEIKAPNDAGDNSITLPTSNGGANQLLQNGGTAGSLQYTSVGGGLHYDSTGRLLHGTSTARTVGSFAASGAFLQVEGTNYQSSSASFINNQNVGDGPYLLLGKSRGTSLTSSVAVTNGDGLGSIWFNGADGANFRRGAIISSAVDGSVGSDVMPGKLTFSTNGGSAEPTDRVEIGSNGALKLLAGCPGIDFSAISPNAETGTTVDNNLLDDYEEGEWTPTVGSGTTYNQRQGTYVRVGKLVMVNYYITIDVMGTGNNRQISGLPFASHTTTGGGVPNYYQNLNQNFNYLGAYTYGSTRLDLYGNAVPDNNMSSSISVFRNGSTLQGAHVYYAA